MFINRKCNNKQRDHTPIEPLVSTHWLWLFMCGKTQSLNYRNPNKQQTNVMRFTFLTEQGLCLLHLETGIKESRASQPWAAALKCTSFAKLLTNFVWSKARTCSRTRPLHRPSAALPDEIPWNKKETSTACLVWITERRQAVWFTCHDI